MSLGVLIPLFSLTFLVFLWRWTVVTDGSWMDTASAVAVPVLGAVLAVLIFANTNAAFRVLLLRLWSLPSIGFLGVLSGRAQGSDEKLAVLPFHAIAAYWAIATLMTFVH